MSYEVQILERAKATRIILLVLKGRVHDTLNQQSARASKGTVVNSVPFLLNLWRFRESFRQDTRL